MTESSCSSLPGATMISCFFERILRNVKSFCGSISLTQVRALLVNWWINPAYWVVVELSIVVRMGMPKNKSIQWCILIVWFKVNCIFLSNVLTLLVYNYSSNYSLVWLDPLQRFLDLRLNLRKNVLKLCSFENLSLTPYTNHCVYGFSIFDTQKSDGTRKIKLSFLRVLW